jgi:hypothetical protein
VKLTARYTAGASLHQYARQQVRRRAGTSLDNGP